MTRKYARVVLTQEYFVDLSDIGIDAQEVRRFHGIGEWDQFDDHDIYQVVDAQMTITEVHDHGELNDEFIENFEIVED